MKKIVAESERDLKFHTISPSPKNSFSSATSSSDFEFTVSISPRKSPAALCPADELFCNGQLLPLHHSRPVPLLLSSSSSSTSSSSDSNTTTSARDSTCSSNGSRSSSNGGSSNSSSIPRLVTDEDDDFKRRVHDTSSPNQLERRRRLDKKTNHFSLSRFSSVFRNRKNRDQNTEVIKSELKTRSKGIGSTAKEVIKKYFKKVQQKMGKTNPSASPSSTEPPAIKAADVQLASEKNEEGRFSISFSGNLRYPRGRLSFLPSCPSSTRSSPSRSTALRRGGIKSMSSSSLVGVPGSSTTTNYADTASMEELHCAIQGAIAHCKNSLIQNSDTPAAPPTKLSS